MCETNQRDPEMKQSNSALRVHAVRARDMHAQTKSFAIAYVIPPSATCTDGFGLNSQICVFKYVCVHVCGYVRQGPVPPGPGSSCAI